MILLSFLFLFFHANSLNYANITQVYYTPEEANAIINSTLAYVNKINQSAYLIFTPNLGKAYRYLSDAEKIYNSSPTTAVAYANLARIYAKQQYDIMMSYAPISIVITLLLAAIFLFLLYRRMKPLRARANRNYKTKH